MIEGQTRIGRSADQGLAQLLAVIQLSVVGRLERKALDLEHLY
jgi:hypothetical protein